MIKELSFKSSKKFSELSGFGDLNKKLISLDYLLTLVHSDELNKVVCPIDDVFKSANKIELDDKQVEKVLTGSFIEMNENHVEKIENKMVFAKHENSIVALGLIKQSNFHPKKLLIK